MFHFNDFKSSFFSQLYHLENDIFCIFNTNEYDKITISLLCEKAREQVAHGFLFQTSGSTSNKKFVLHDFDAVRVSSEHVNKFAGVRAGDKFLTPISIYHMGGFSVLARSYFAQAELPIVVNKWLLTKFLSTVEAENISITSMVPSQIYEIVQTKSKAPSSLKAVFVGGSALEPSLYRAAKDLGWPLFKTFGSTEACSQIFTEDVLLPHWKVRVEEDHRLQISGPSLFKGYLFLEFKNHFSESQQSVRFEAPMKNDLGYFLTEDLVELGELGIKSFYGRMNDYVKINSSLINLKILRDKFYQFCVHNKIDAEKTVISIKEDLKNGFQIVAFTELPLKSMIGCFESWNRKASPPELIRGVYMVSKLPRSELGKVMYSELK